MSRRFPSEERLSQSVGDEQEYPRPRSNAWRISFLLLLVVSAIAALVVTGATLFESHASSRRRGAVADGWGGATDSAYAGGTASRKVSVATCAPNMKTESRGISGSHSVRPLPAAQALGFERLNPSFQFDMAKASSVSILPRASEVTPSRGHNASFSDRVNASDKSLIGVAKTHSASKGFTTSPRAFPPVVSVNSNDQFFAGTGGTLSSAAWSAAGTMGPPYSSNFVAGDVANFAVVNGTAVGATISVGGINATENITITAASGTLGGTSGKINPITVGNGKVFDAGAQVWSTSPSVGFSFTGPGGVFATAGGTFGGGFVLNSGTLIARGVNAMGSGSTLAINGGTIAGPISGSGSTAGGTKDFSLKYAGGITIGGDFQLGALSTAVALSSSTASLTFSDIMSLGATTRTVTIGANGVYSLNGVIQGNSGVGLTINALSGATGTLSFGGGTTANTYSGTTTINSGELDLNKTAGVNAIAGSIVIGDGSGTDTLKLVTANQISDTSDVTMNGAGTPVFNLTINSETIDGLVSTNSSASIILTSGTLTLGANNEAAATFAGIISGTNGNLIKIGTGIQTLSGANSYSGATTINSGTLTLDSAGSTTARLAATSSVTVNSGGTLLLANSSGTTSSNRVNNAASIKLAGGTLNLGGLSEGGTSANGVGALTLTATSTINFGTPGTNNLIQFAGLGTHTAGAMLQILNWEGTAGSGGENDQLLFAGTSSTFTGMYSQSDVMFNGITGYGVIQDSGYFEVYGITAVPEPSTWAAGALAVLLVAYSQRRRLSKGLKS